MREFALLEHVYAANASLGKGVLIPPGDDMGMVAVGEGAPVLAAVDQVVEGRHFDIRSIPVELVGRKAVTRCLSDVAAMAARPVCSLAAVVLPPDFGEDRARRLFHAMRETASAFDAPLIGGDIAIHAGPGQPLVCSVTVLATPLAADLPPILRGGARPGDDLFVTGALGRTLDANGLGHHLTFTPRIAEAAALSRLLRSNLHAMIDLSDGLGRDAGHIAQMSGVQIEIDAALIPRRAGASWREALADGEDYELCFAASGPVPSAILGVPVTRIGGVLAAPGVADRERTGGSWSVVVIDGPDRVDASALGWEHRSP